MQAWSCGATCTSGSVAKTGTLASALYVIESAADGARLHFPPSRRIEQEVEKLEGCTTAVQVPAARQNV